MISIPKILILAVIQGVSELLPISSSAHVIVAEKMMGLDPTQPAMTLLLVMLHTGTMFAVIVFFWNSWKTNFFASRQDLWESLKLMGIATLATVVVGMILKVIIEKIFLRDVAHAEIELIFGDLNLMAAALAAAGVLILSAAYMERPSSKATTVLGAKAACLIGLVQGICLPFRGFSRSGATISTGLILGIEKRKVEDFSFALAVILTPAVIAREALRFLKGQQAIPHGTAYHGPMHHGTSLIALFLPSLIGMFLSFIAGLLALKWLSSWLEGGRWYLFGVYCLCAGVVIFFLHCQGF